MATQQKFGIYHGDTPSKKTPHSVQGDYITLLDDNYYCIRNYDALDPFFMTLVSSSNHWLFISTTGGLSAGRIDSDHALFPYYTVDKITENSENTGTKTSFLVTTNSDQMLWEPFSNRYAGVYQIERNLYKNVLGTSVVFEEINHDLDLTYRYAWRTSQTYGFVKTSYLINNRDEPCHIQILDGLQNILPAHVSVDVQSEYSNLLDAYKYSELHAPTGLGMYALSSRLTDLAEPSESLRANIVWQVGLDNVTHLISSSQLEAFNKGAGVSQEEYVRAKRGAYFIHTEKTLDPNTEYAWHIVADVEQDSAQVALMVNRLQNQDDLFEKVEQDIQKNHNQLDSIIAQADGKQESSDDLSTAHHIANVLFNVMRGGIFTDHYNIETADLKDFIGVHKPVILQSHAGFFDALPEQMTVSELREKADSSDSVDLMRLCYSYLPLTFSRRHGDPSRPWNQFRINVTNPDGSQRLDYQGNWRDIFQNWEALSYSYPQFIQGMISTFLNATTADGYNPYRITRDGIDWEVPDPDDAWANIGYWNDHQIIYLQKLLEVCEQFYPNSLDSLLNRRMFTHANVPYQIKPYSELLKNAYDTIDFDWDKEEQVLALVEKIGADGKLVHDANGDMVYATLTEKLLLLLLTKLSNFVPEGGIWLNTQRPEWNDANNALVGKGLSVVTLGYIRRYIVFFADLLQNTQTDDFTVSTELASLFTSIKAILENHQPDLESAIDDKQRRVILDQLSQAGSQYRWQFYQNGLSNDIETLSRTHISAFLQVAQAHVEHALRANKRDDNLYHAYNVLHLKDDQATISTLSLMLEGQVSILSSGLLSPEEALNLLQALPDSTLYREDQHSYMLYPNRDLKGFLAKNSFTADELGTSSLVATMQQQNDTRLITKDVNDVYHFNGNIRNADDVSKILLTLEQEPTYTDAVQSEREQMLDLFEHVFDHASFTGRSGTFFAFEGLGSIYWHMVSKLLLATQEVVIDAIESNTDADIIQALKDCYEDVRAGIGFNKSPDIYGAFPTDPYSHTPLGAGAKQPGMTGMVKEEILTRFVELGILIEDGVITFKPELLREQELLETPSTLTYLDIEGNQQQLDVPAKALAFTLCQIPMVVQRSASNMFEITYADGQVKVVDGHRLNADISREVYARNGAIDHITIHTTNIS